MLFAPLLAEESPTALVVHPFWVLVSIVNFLVLLYLLRRFMWGPITATLDRRAAKIREGLDLTEAARREREQLKQEVERILAQARREAAEIAERMTKAAETAAVDIRAEAKAEADRIREKGRIDAQHLHDQVLAQLRSEVASMVVLAASRILGREINADQHRALIERSLDEAGAELKRI
ncbi:MAG TPA: F0F1 ATP synthase subunit B [Candidatus Limnocylindria bacterium]|jgi:F-type H+-transporting ATPase subunit b|nr:F0F1 ATP synthase subunit B [Candidatus Limnocylindria bacterium]